MATMSYPKYDTLPQIMTSRGDPEYTPKITTQPLPNSTSMPSFFNPSAGGQMVPYNQSGPKYNFSLDDSSRNRSLEMRLAAAEQSNRTVLDEVVRLQNEMRMGMRRLEESVHNQIPDKDNLDQSIRISKQSIIQLAGRLQNVELSLERGQSSVSTLTSQISRVEQSLAAAQRDLSQRNETYFTKLNSVSQSLDEWGGERNKMQGAISLLANEIRVLKRELDARAVEYKSLEQEFKNRNAYLESESHSMVDYVRKTKDQQTDSEYQQQQLKNNVESRLHEIRDTLIELNNKTAREESERRAAEQNFNKKIADQQIQISEQSRALESFKHELMKQASITSQSFDRERVESNDKLMKSEEETKRKLHFLELEFKKELAQRIADFDKMYQTEKEQRFAGEKNIRTEAQSALNEMQKKIDSEMTEIKRKMKADKSKYNTAYTELNKSIELIDRRHNESYDKLSSAVKAEISTRETQDQLISSKTDDLNHKLGIAIKTIQVSIGALEAKYKSLKTDYRKEFDDLKNEVHLSITRGLSDLDLRVQSLTTKLHEHETNCDAKVKQSDQNQSERSAKISLQLAQWHEQITARIDELQESYQRLKTNVFDLEARLANGAPSESTKSPRQDRVPTPRMEELQRLRTDMNNKLVHVPSKYFVDQLEESLNNQRDDLDLALAECKRIGDAFIALQNSYDSRIDNESTTRAEQLAVLRESVSRLKRLVEYHHGPTDNSVTDDVRTETPKEPESARSANLPIPAAPNISSPVNNPSDNDPDRWQEAD